MEYRSLETLNKRSNELHDLVDAFYESHFKNKSLPYYDRDDTINTLLYMRRRIESLIEDYVDNKSFTKKKL